MPVRSVVAITALLVSLAVAVPVTAAEPSGVERSAPAAAWSVDGLGTVGRDPCIPWYWLKRCTRYGGLAANGSTVLLLDTDGGPAGELGSFDYAQHRRSANGGSSFGTAHVFSSNVEGPDLTKMPAMAQRGTDVDVIYDGEVVARSVRVRHSGDLGLTFGAATRLPRPRQVVTNVAIANGAGNRVAVAIAGYDEATTERPSFAVEVHVSSDDGASFPVRKRFTWNRAFCFYLGTDPTIAITGNGTIVLAYWQTCKQLVVRRSLDGGVSWSPATRLSSGPHTLGASMAVNGDQVVLAYTAGGDTLTRRSSNAGAGWSAPVNAGSGASSLRVTHAGGVWRLLAGGTDRIRYRTSSDGLGWSAGETVFESIGARTYAIGLTYSTAPLAAFVVRTADKVNREYVARR